MTGSAKRKAADAAPWLQGKIALITGASRGIGEATARYFAQHGACVGLLARSGQALERIVHEIDHDGGTAIPLVADVARFDDLQRAVQTALRRFGKVDILVNNAGLIAPISHLADSDPVTWSYIADVNLKGVYYGMRAVIPHMLRAGGGSIVNLSSGAATSALEGWSHYCATKAGVLSLTKCAHTEYGNRGIQVVGLSPGTVNTAMQSAIRKSGINPVSKLSPSSHIPAAWVARAIAFLCGEAGREFSGTDFSLKTKEGRLLAGLPPSDT